MDLLLPSYSILCFFFSSFLGFFWFHLGFYFLISFFLLQSFVFLYHFQPVFQLINSFLSVSNWMASTTQWTWVWASSGRWWRTRKPGVLQSMGSQRVRHNWVTEQQQFAIIYLLWLLIFNNCIFNFSELYLLLLIHLVIFIVPCSVYRIFAYHNVTVCFALFFIFNLFFY